MTTEPNENVPNESYNGTAGSETGDCEIGLDSPELGQLPLDQQVALLAEGLQSARQEAAQNLDSFKRAQAEMANFRRRTDEERITSVKYANSRLIEKFLPAIEELDLAIGQAGSSGPWIEGVKLIQRKLNGVLESEGVTPIEADGAIFNPMEHEAVGIEDSNTHPPGYVTQTLRPGYRLRDRVVRAAQVMVAREPQAPAQPSNNSGEEGNNG